MAIYLIMMYTLTLSNSQSQQKVANTLPLLHLLLPKTHSLLQNLLKTLDKLLRQEVRLDHKNLWQQLWSSWPLVLYICTLRNKLHSHQIKVIHGMRNDANKIINENIANYTVIWRINRNSTNIIQITINALKILSAFHSLRDIIKNFLKLLSLIIVAKKLKMLLKIIFATDHLKATENVSKGNAFLSRPR